MSLHDSFNAAMRFEKLVTVLVRHESLFLIKRELSIWHKHNKTEPLVVREILEEMGGGFVKLGQLLSMRPDLIPIEYANELSKLQDSVKIFPYSEAKKIIESSIGKKISDVFSEFNSKPIASASIGQVYKAKLKSGERVAVKVKRPGIDKLFEQDISLMEKLASSAKGIHGVDIIDPEEVVLAFKEYTARELDYEEEAKTLDRFHINLLESGVRVPKPFISLSSKDCLIMEFIEGHELKNIIEKKGFDEYKKNLAKIIFNSFLKQIFIDGEFHADPHPANIIVMSGKKHNIALLDFGISGTLTTMMKAEIVKLFIALNEKDMDGVISAMMHMNLVSADNEEVRKDFKDMLGPYYGQGLNKIDFPKLFIQSIKVARKHKVRVPKDYVLLAKAVITIESVCAQLNPHFNFAEESKPFITKLMIHEYSPAKFIASSALKIEQARSLAFQIPAIVSKILSKSDYHDKKVEELSAHLIRSEHRIDVLIEKLLLMFTTMVLIISGVLMLKFPPIYDGVSIFSIILFCFATATFLLAVLKKSKISN